MKIKGVGVVGSASWTQFTLAQLKELGVRDLFLGGDPFTCVRRERMNKIAREFSKEAPLWSVSEMYDKVDAVVLCLPPKENARWALPLLDAGVSVFVQKPLAPSYDEAKELAEAAMNSKAIIHGGSDFPFRPDVLKAKQMIEDRSIGQIRYISGAFCSSLSPQCWRKENGVVFDFGPHVVSVVRKLLGEYTLALSGVSKTSVAMKFAGETWEGGVFLSWESPRGSAPELTLYGSEGKIELYGSSVVLYKSSAASPLARHLWRWPGIERRLSGKKFRCKGEHSYLTKLKKFLVAVETGKDDGCFSQDLEDLKAIEMAILEA